MNKELWQQVEQIYFSALELRVEERKAYLEAACAGEAELRREVEALLASEDQAQDFLEIPAMEQAAKELAAELPTQAQTQSLPMPVPQQRLGHYKLLAPLGKGGMGEVYLALDTRLNRKAAIKLLPAQFTHEADRVRRFAQEARAASALNHPNILTIYEIGKIPADNGSIHYIATEYVEGETLRQRLANAPGSRLPLATAIEIALQMTAALVAAHEAGIIHRDLKPENIMVRRDGLVKVLDFGLAKLIERRGDAAMGRQGEEADTLLAESPRPPVAASLTLPGIVMGTPRYMSPEQARGDKVDARTDLFSLGIVFYELFTGTPPFTGASPMDVISAILTAEPKALRSLRADVPIKLEQIIHHLLRKNREQRIASTQELLAELKTCQQEMEAVKRVAPTPPKRRSWWIVGAAMITVLLGGSWFWFSRPSSDRKPLRSEFSEMFLGLGRWNVPPTGWEIRGERLFIANQSRVGYTTNITADDFTMTFLLRLENADGAAWVLRIRDQDNYYLFHLDGSKTATRYFSAYIVREGKLGEAVSQIPVTKQLIAGGHYTVNITAKGNEITHLLNSADDPSADTMGDPLGYFKDENNLYPSGGIGFRSVGTEQFSVDDLYVRPLSLHIQ
ncbi:MAG: serine/threonine protein kinase [Blastocatellia bacterium]|nr:serine/threonine protein kinase [Blastocatellia bacterium]